MSRPPCVILAGGRGTRLSDATSVLPKPLIDVGDKPLLQHIIDIYQLQGVEEFVIPVGYRKEYIYAYFLSRPDVIRADRLNGGMVFEFPTHEIYVADTGMDTQTGGRLKRLERILRTPFFFTYGDGLANVNISKLFEQHASRTDLVTITAVHPEGRFGRMHLEGTNVVSFGEKIESESEWINGGFAVIDPLVLPLINGDETNLEKDIYPHLAHAGTMGAFRHTGFWQCVDTARDLDELRRTYKERGLVWLELS